MGAADAAPVPVRADARRFLVGEGPGACGRLALDDAFALLAHAVGPRGRRLMLARGGKPLGGVPPAQSHWAVGGEALSLPWPLRRGEQKPALSLVPNRAGAAARAADRVPLPRAGELRLAQARERLLAERFRAHEEEEQGQAHGHSGMAFRQVAPSLTLDESEGAEEEVLKPLLLEGGTAVATSARFRTMLRTDPFAAAVDLDEDFGFSFRLPSR
jgi:hypothetical protein